MMHEKKISVRGRPYIRDKQNHSEVRRGGVIHVSGSKTRKRRREKLRSMGMRKGQMTGDGYCGSNDSKRRIESLQEHQHQRQSSAVGRGTQLKEISSVVEVKLS
jgi:predicted secreted protein